MFLYLQFRDARNSSNVAAAYTDTFSLGVRVKKHTLQDVPRVSASDGHGWRVMSAGLSQLYIDAEIVYKSSKRLQIRIPSFP